MKNKKLMSFLAVGILTVSFPVMAPLREMGDSFYDQRPETDNGPRKQEPRKGGIFDGVFKFFKPKSGKINPNGGKTNTTAVAGGNGGKGAGDGDNGITFVGDQSDGNNGATAQELAVERAVGRDAKSFDRPNNLAIVEPKETILTKEQKNTLVDKSDLSITQKAIVKSLVGNTNDVKLLIGAMKNVEMEVINKMTGPRGNVVSDLNKDDKYLVLQLERIRSECQDTKRTDNQIGREFDIEKLRIVDALLRPINKKTRDSFFNIDIEPQVRRAKEKFRSKIR